MQSSISKIHVNNSTRLSLNDRFTIMKDVGGGPSSAHAPPTRGRSVSRSRNRSRSRSRSRGPQISVAPVNRATSLRNRQMVSRLDQRHMLQTALKIKRVCFPQTSHSIYPAPMVANPALARFRQMQTTLRSVWSFDWINAIEGNRKSASLFG